MIVKFRNLSIRKRSYFILAVMCILLYGFSLPYSVLQEPKFVGGNDFKAHAHFMLSYAESFISGQWIPRTLTSLELFNDGALPVADAPTFQYYGFFEGLVALPFHILHFSPANAAVCAVILTRTLCAFAMYETCRILGATATVSILANFAFLLSPYTMSCFYSRGALAESLSHSLLVLIFYGFALAWVEKYRQSILVFALGFAFLILCHNIFLVYGAVLVGALLIASGRWRIILSGAIGASLGILVTSWQWIPAQQTVAETMFGRMLTWKIPAVLSTETHSASWSGAFGFPQKFTASWDTNIYQHFFTIGWWSLPLIIALAFAPRERRRLAFAVFVSAIVFLALTFSPVSTYLFKNLLPGFFNVVQNTYRLISFVSLISAFALAIIFPKIKSIYIYIIMLLMVLSQAYVILTYFALIRQEAVNRDAVIGAPINAYYSTPHSPHRIRDLVGLLDQSNIFNVSLLTDYEFSLRLVGRREPAIPAPDPALVYIVKVINTKPEIYEPVTIKKELPSDFDVFFESIPVNSDQTRFRIITEDKASGKPVLMMPQGFFLYEGKMSNYVQADDIDIKHSRGYLREFKIKPSKLIDVDSSSPNSWILELPMAYSPLFRAYQNGVLLETSVDFNHRMRVRVNSLRSPVIVKFHWSPTVLLLTFIGFIGIFLVLCRGFFSNKQTINRSLFIRYGR